MSTITLIRDLTDEELNRQIAHVRRKRDAFARGREPRYVMARLRHLLAEQARRRDAR